MIPLESFHPCVKDLALLHVIEPDRTLLRGLPAFIRYHHGLFVTFQLTQKSDLTAEYIADPVHTGHTAIPAVSKIYFDQILSDFQKPRHIIDLRRKTIVIIRTSGCQNSIADSLAVQIRDIQAPGSDVQPAFPDPLYHKLLSETCRRLMFARSFLFLFPLFRQHFFLGQDPFSDEFLR